MTPIDELERGDDVFVGGSQYNDTDTPEQQRFGLAFANLQRRSHQLIPLDFLPHGVSVFPGRPERLVCCEKKGPNAAIVDQSTMQKLSALPLPEGRRFYGHCAFSANGDTLYTTEILTNSGEGLIAVRDGVSGELMGDFPSFGHAPHECQLIDGGATMVVSNGGGSRNGAVPNVAYIDVASQRLLRRETPSSFAVNTGHFSIAADGSLVVVSAPRDGSPSNATGGVSIQPVGKPLRTVSSPKKVVRNMIGEALSVAVVGTQTVVTHPDGDMITVWSTDSRALVKRLDLPKPRGLARSRDRRHLVVAYGHDTSLMLLDTERLELRASSHFPYSYIAGSHVYNLAELLHTA